MDQYLDVMDQYLDVMDQFLDVTDQFLDPETDIMGERNNIQGIKTLLRANTVFRCQECAKVSRLITYLASKVGIGTGGENY